MKLVGKVEQNILGDDLRNAATIAYNVALARPHLNLSAEERNAARDHATRAAAGATAQIRNLARTDQAAAAGAAWATFGPCTWPPP